MSLRRPLAAVLAVSVLALTGCGVTATGVHPGQAASINGETISVAEVDDVAGSACAVLRSNPEFEGQVITGTAVRNAAQRSLALRTMADQVLEDLDLTLPATASDGADAYRSAYGSADPADVEAAEPVFTADQHLSNVLVAVGTDEVGADAGDDAIITAGVEKVRAWQADADIVTNPLFEAVEIGETQILSTRDDLSVATSEFAVQASTAETPEGFAAELPESQRCGG
ncbi:hypothetical protein [Nocardioides sp. W7]|uniref:hypothetical protein n=1 Tax=Nocardioides sp. W7 TaxID=2931390 RepID=UPI001FD3A811|nr:hypothetical protein [Nocardioides sp. W7]